MKSPSTMSRHTICSVGGMIAGGMIAGGMIAEVDQLPPIFSPRASPSSPGILRNVSLHGRSEIVD